MIRAAPSGLRWISTGVPAWPRPGRDDGGSVRYFGLLTVTTTSSALEPPCPSVTVTRNVSVVGLPGAVTLATAEFLLLIVTAGPPICDHVNDNGAFSGSDDVDASRVKSAFVLPDLSPPGCAPGGAFVPALTALMRPPVTVLPANAALASTAPSNFAFNCTVVM